MKLGVGLALLALLKGDAIFTAASLSCHRVASQWTVVFTEQCTKWFRKGGSKTHLIPKACEQGFAGGVAVDAFPWNDAVIVVDNEDLADNFDLQPAQQVVQYGAGVVIMQTTWDMMDQGQWRARNTSMARRVHPEVHHLSAGEEKYVNLDVHVHFAPRGARTVAWEGEGGGSKPTETDAGDYHSTYNYDEDDDVTLAADISPFASWFSYELEADIAPGGDDGMHHPRHVFSYDYELHRHDLPGPFHPEDFGSFSYGFVHDEPDWHWIDSYDFSDSFSHGFSFDFDENLPPAPRHVRTVTSMDFYVCSDEGRALAESGFYCDPNNRGTHQCYKKANASNIKALSLHNMKMYCDPECLSDEVGGLWCDIFGLNGCRMCREDCGVVCEGDENCQCVQCDDDISGGMETPPPSPESTGYFTPSPTEDASTSAPSMGPLGFEASAAPTTVGSTAFETLSPTVGLGRDLLEFPVMSAAPTVNDDIADCVYGDNESCYDQLSPAERVDLESARLDLTCEESCISEYGQWCNAMGLRGCRFCAFDCDEFCAKLGSPEDCLCFEC